MLAGPIVAEEPLIPLVSQEFHNQHKQRADGLAGSCPLSGKHLFSHCVEFASDTDCCSLCIMEALDERGGASEQCFFVIY